MHFLITGHTGFKGAWLTLLLKHRGHQVSGVSLTSENDSLFKRAGVSSVLVNDITCDIRNFVELEKHFLSINPDVVIHLAAQSLVCESYLNPIITFETNSMGTINVLKASQSVDNLKAQLIITTDKVYKNVNKSTGYVESDPLGGQDPYSASKAMADLATQSWISSFTNAPTAIARAGNVIGGGDISIDRLMPDLVNHFVLEQAPKLRAPHSVRPWQHVLDCLNGYLLLVDSLIDKKNEGEWNFGPDDTQIRTVADVVELSRNYWGASKEWEIDENDHPYEASLLLLNSNKSRRLLGWNDKLNFEESVRWTIDWYKKIHQSGDALQETMKNIFEFESK